jgi:hypothetical protein
VETDWTSKIGLVSAPRTVNGLNDDDPGRPHRSKQRLRVDASIRPLTSMTLLIVSVASIYVTVHGGKVVRICTSELTGRHRGRTTRRLLFQMRGAARDLSAIAYMEALMVKASTCRGSSSYGPRRVKSGELLSQA